MWCALGGGSVHVGYQDQALPKFKETFWNSTYQPYAEYEWHASDKLNVTAGVKYSYFDLDVLHYADDGGANSAYAGTLTCTSLTRQKYTFFNV